MASGSDTLANTLMPVLLTGATYQPATKIATSDLTTGVVGGTGVFDLLMTSLVAHLKVEYAANRISGAEYTKAYIGVVAAALEMSSQFLLGKEQAYWQALIAEANYALTKLKISSEDATYGNLLVQKDSIVAGTALSGAQKDNTIAQGVGIAYTNANILPLQKNLLQEQIEVQRAQTLDTRVDGATITGTLGKQKSLYTQQITSYKNDSELKATKIFSDAWITQKTIDEGVLAPSQFTNTNIDAVLTQIRTNLGI